MKILSPYNYLDKPILLKYTKNDERNEYEKYKLLLKNIIKQNFFHKNKWEEYSKKNSDNSFLNIIYIRQELDALVTKLQSKKLLELYLLAEKIEIKINGKLNALSKFKSDPNIYQHNILVQTNRPEISILPTNVINNLNDLDIEDLNYIRENYTSWT